MILLTTIQNKLELHISKATLRFEFDVRYMKRWIEEYPQCFPNFIINGNYKTIFNYEKLRYEFHRNS